MIKAAFFDVDGTLLSHKTKSVPRSAREAVAKLQASGIKCIVATGRQIGEMNKLPVADMPFDGYITLNGQLTLDREKKMIYGTPITGRAKTFLLDLFEKNRLPALLVEEDRLYLNYVDDRVRLVQETISSPIPPFGAYTGNDIYQVCAYMSPGDEKLLEEIADDCVMTRWSLGGMDIIAKGGGKVEGIRKFLQREGIAVEETIAFGDAENDIEMLKFAGIGVAMGNGEEGAKQAADYITADIDDDGVAKALRHFGLI